MTIHAVSVRSVEVAGVTIRYREAGSPERFHAIVGPFLSAG
jgi:hypothetical protein